MTQRERFLLYGSLFSAVVLVDLAKFRIVGESNIINWHSFAHPFWVILATALIFIYAKFQKTILRRFLFWSYLAVFAAAYLNQYFRFSEILTYNCMLFNLALTTAYFFSVIGPRERREAG